MLLPLLCGFAFLAGLIDAVVGGGGLIQIPALMILLPGAPIPTLWGTNKLASVCGTSFATYRYSRHVEIDFRIVAPAAAVAFVSSFLGSRAVTLLRPEIFRPIVLVLLFAVAAYVFFVKDLGLIHRPKHPRHRAVGLGLLIGGALGFYDGFFGPGTGSFLIFAFVGIFGFDFLCASASAKLINLATNLASALYFGAAGHILYRIALPMAVCNILGALVGTRLAILKGSRFVRLFFLAVVCLLIARLAQQLF
jgi:uncharacterized membrane protein YfcA